jgi:hypothetical protein
LLCLRLHAIILWMKPLRKILQKFNLFVLYVSKALFHTMTSELFWQTVLGTVAEVSVGCDEEKNAGFDHDGDGGK